MARDTSYIFTGRERPEVGEEVVFWGKQGNETLYLYEVAAPIEALPYELPTWLSPELPRVFVENTNVGHGPSVISTRAA
jgi:alanine racemase